MRFIIPHQTQPLPNPSHKGTEPEDFVTMPTATPTLIDELAQSLGAERVLTAPEDVAVYAYDATAALRQNPGCVVFPKSTEEVAACVKAARRFGVPVVTRGSGTGLSGGSVPTAGCLVLCLTGMNR